MNDNSRASEATREGRALAGLIYIILATFLLTGLWRIGIALEGLVPTIERLGVRYWTILWITNGSMSR